MSDQQQTIKWGDVLRIHGVGIIPSQDFKGLIISKGFTDPNVYYQTYTNYDQVNFYRESLFQIYPKVNFDLHDSLQNDQSLTPQQRDDLKQRALEQLGNLQKTLSTKHQDVQHPDEVYVTYGAEVVFKHIQSGQYLCGVFKAADIREGAFKLELSKQPSSHVIFKIVSHRSYENQGNKIYYDDCLRIHHVKTDCYMNFPDADKPIILDQPYEVTKFNEEDPGYKYAQSRPNIKKPVRIRINVINQNKPKCLWKFIQHCRYEDSMKKQKIKSHDIVYFQHTKNKGLIASTLAQQKYYLKELKEDNDTGISYECFWELIPKEGNQFGPQKCNTFWARNIVTGQILVYNGFKVQIESKFEVEGGGFNSGGLVNLICEIETTEQGQSKKLLQRHIQIPNDQNVNDVVKYFEEKKRKIDFKAVVQLTQDSFVIFRVPEQTILDVSYVLSSQQAFVKIVEITSTELKKKTTGIHNNWVEMFMSLNGDLLDSFINVLKMLAGKIYATDYDNIQASGKSPILQIQKILVQTGIAQLLIQIIFTLYDPFRQIISYNGITEDKAIRIKISQIFELSYILVEKIVKDFIENKIYFSRWVDLFLQHTNNINRAFIQQCLVNILQNNPNSIKAMINETIINQLINYFFQEAAQGTGDLTTKHLRLFSTFIKGDNVIFKDNQKIILDAFFNNENNNYTFKFKVEYRTITEDNEEDDIRGRAKNKLVKLAFAKDDPCTIQEFFERSPQKFNYLLSYVNLLADVCMDRNNEAIEYVQTNLPLSVVTTILFDNKIEALNQRLKEANTSEIKRFPNTNIHQPFIRIGHHAYVNNFKFSPINRIRKIVKWYKYDQGAEVTEVEDITRTKRVYEGEKQEQEKTYLNYLLLYIKKFLQTCNKDINNLQLLYTVLNFLQETIILGLWDSIDEFRDIIPQLIKNIIKIESFVFFEGYDEKAKNRYNPKEWVNNNKGALKMNRPQINLIIECKRKAAQIFKYINEMEIDIRLRYLMNYFQGIYEATQNFENYSQPIQDEVEVTEFENDEEKDAVQGRNSQAKEQFYKVIGTGLLGGTVVISQQLDVMLKDTLWYNKISTMIPLNTIQKTGQPDKDRDLFRKSEEESLDPIVLSLFELTGYHNKNLLNSTLNMLRAMFEQRHDLIQSYKNLLYCGRGNLNEVYSNLKFMRNKFAMLKNDTIIKYDGDANKSFAYDIFKPYDHLGRQEDKRSGIIQDLFFLARTLKDNVSLKNIESLMYVDRQVFNKDIVYHFYNEKEKNNSLFQQLNMAQEIYQPLLDYIIIIGNQENIPEKHRWLLFSIYQYLTLLCFNNMKAKHLFMNYIPYILPHLNKRVGAASFLYEVCINNKLLVNSEERVKMIIDGALNACIALQSEEVLHHFVSNSIHQNLQSNTNFQKSRILYSLRGILIFNDEGNKMNQQMLMNKLQDNKYRRLVFKGSLKYTAKREEFNLSPAETYATAHFELFSTLVESQNAINIGKLQNLHPYTFCLQKLSETNRWQIRRALRSYVNRLYYVPKDKDIFLFEEFIRKQFNIINKQFEDLIGLHVIKMLTEDLKVKNGIRFVYAQSQIILLIIQILITLHQIFLKPQFIKLLKKELQKEIKVEDHLKKLHQSLINLLRNLGSIEKLYINTKTIVSFAKEIKKLMEPVLLTFHVRYLQKKSEPETSQQPKDEQAEVAQSSAKKNTYKYDSGRPFFRNLVEMIKFLKKYEKLEKQREKFLKQKNDTLEASETDIKKRYIDAIFAVLGTSLRPINPIKIKQEEEMHYKPHLQTAHSDVLKVLAKPEYEQNELNLQLNTRLNNVKEMLTDSPAFKKVKQDEFYKLVKIFINMDERASEMYQQNWKSLGQDMYPVFPRKEIITSCFELMINEPDKISDPGKIFIIKLVRCYITETVEGKQNHKLSPDEWSADYYTDETARARIDAQEKSELVKRQHQIEQCGGSRLLLSIFKDNLYDKPQLLNEALLLGIAYLYNGNTHCQNSILAELTADDKNQALFSLRNLIRSIGKFLIVVRKFKQNEKKRAFAYKIVDSYDHFDSKQNILVKLFGHKTNKYQIQTQLSYEMALRRTFRFLQLFCENNNIEMKKFVMRQTNLDGNEKLNSINFIVEACMLLRQFFKIMSANVVNIPPNLLDFINEITQIPCLECQKSLMSSTFFEDMSYMAGFFESKQNIYQRKFPFYVETEPRQEDDGKGQRDDSSLQTLQQLYEKGVGLALSNFEGNDNEIYLEFLNKAQAKYLWIVIRQNMIRMLRPLASRFGVARDKVETQLEEYYAKNDSKRMIFAQFRDFLVEKEFIKRIFAAFNRKEITRFINQQKAKDKVFCGQICNILSVISILKKIQDYAEDRTRAATANPEQINLEENQKAKKARDFRKQLMIQATTEEQEGKKDQEDKYPYPHIAQFLAILEEQILSIEISSNNGEKVAFSNLYFPNHPVFSYLAPDTKDSIMFQVVRQTRRDKLTSLFAFYQQLKQQIDFNYDLKYYTVSFWKFTFPFSITSEIINNLRRAARYVSYIICLLMLLIIVVEHDTTSQESYFNFFYYQQKIVMRVLTTVQLILTLLFFSLWLKMRWSLSVSKYYKNLEGQEGGGESAEQQVEEEDGQIELKPPEGKVEKVVFYSVAYAVKISKYFFKTMNQSQTIIGKIKYYCYDFLIEKPGFSHLHRFLTWLLTPIYNYIKDILIGLYALVTYEGGFLAILVFVIASLLGNFYGIEWYVMHLFDYFVGISLLTNVFKAVIDNISELLLLSCFAGCFIMVFNIVSLNIYTPVIFEDDIPEEACESLLDCVIQVYTSGAINGDMDQIYADRFIFDTVYFIFMDILFSNLISGIMIDGFGALKEEDAERYADKKSKCFICAMQKAQMEKRGTTFKKHTDKHFLWNYMFYKYVVNMKDSSDYTGLEYDISTQLSEEKVQWFPDNGPKQESGQIEQLMVALKEKMGKVSEQVNKMLDKNSGQIKTGSGAIKAILQQKPAIQGGQHVEAIQGAPEQGEPAPAYE